MDDLERRLREYDEYNRAQISEEFLQRLKALEANPETAQRPRGRYVLPVAAAVALAICLGSVWAWLHFSRPVDHRTPPAVTLEEPPADAADTPIPSEPAPPETSSKTEMLYTSKPPAGDPSPALPIFAPKPVQDGTAQTNSDAPAGARSEEPTSAKPDDTTPAAPEDGTPDKPNDPSPAKPDVPPSDDPNPPAPDDPDPPAPDDPNPTEPDAPDPPEPDDPDPPGITLPEDIPPFVPEEPPQIMASCRSAYGKETLTLSLLSTGESVDVDVTGLVALDSGAHTPEGEEIEVPAGETMFIGIYSAFGCQVAYQLTRADDDTIDAQVIDLCQD